MERVPESCADVLSGLPLYVGADLEPEVQAAVDRHLQACGECRMAADRVQAARQVLWSEYAETEVPADLDLWDSLRPQLADEGLFEGVPARRPLPMWRVASYAAAAALLFSITILQFTGPASPVAVPGNPIAITDGASGDPGPAIETEPARNRSEFFLRPARDGEEWLYAEARPLDYEGPIPRKHVHPLVPVRSGQPQAEVVIFAPRNQ